MSHVMMYPIMIVWWTSI